MSGENAQILTNRPLPGARLNMAHPLAKGLVGCWLLNENGGTRALDLSPYASHGKLTGFAAPPKRSFNGLTFDGSATYVPCGNGFNLQILGNMSMEVWLKLSSLEQPGGSGFPRVISKGQVDSNNRSFDLEFNNGTKRFQVIICRNGGTYVVVSPLKSDWVAQRWYQFISTYDRGIAAGNLKFYLDSVFLLSGNGTLAISNSPENFVIGGTPTATPGIAGTIAVVRLWKNVVLNAQDVKSLFISPYSPMGLSMFI